MDELMKDICSFYQEDSSKTGVKEARGRMYWRHMAGNLVHASCVINFLLLCNLSRKGAQHVFCLVSEGLNMAILLKSWQTDGQRGSQTHSE